MYCNARFKAIENSDWKVQRQESNMYENLRNGTLTFEINARTKQSQTFFQQHAEIVWSPGQAIEKHDCPSEDDSISTCPKKQLKVYGFGETYAKRICSIG